MNHTERAAQPSTIQTHGLQIFLEKNPSLAKGFSKVPSARDRARKTWEELALQLNSLGGCVKTWKQWTKYWTDKKNAVRKKAALRFRNRNKPGGEVVELSEIEERILTLMGGESFAIGDRELEIDPFFVAEAGQYPDSPSLMVSTQLKGHNPVLSLPMKQQSTPSHIEDFPAENVPVVEETLIAEESEPSESDHGVRPHSANFRKSTEEHPFECPISRESITERPASRESSSRKRTESNADPLSDYFPTSKRQRRVQHPTVASKQTEEDFSHKKDRSNEEVASAVVECDLYGQLLAQKLKPLDVKDRLVLMNDIDNLVFKHLMNITNRSKLSRRSAELSPSHGDTDNCQSTDQSRCSSRSNHIQNESQNDRQNSQHEMIAIKIEADD